jgi:hypothetical protein
VKKNIKPAVVSNTVKLIKTMPVKNTTVLSASIIPREGIHNHHKLRNPSIATTKEGGPTFTTRVNVFMMQRQMTL